MPDGERGYSRKQRLLAQFESPVSKAADSAYSGFLQSYDQELGSKSYGAVVDLLVAYYGGM